MSVIALLKAAALAVTINAPSELSSDRQADCLASNIWFEARGSSFADKLAVAHVVLNRVKSDDYPDNICAVVYQRHQFSWTNDGKSDQVVVDTNTRRAAWDDTALATRLALSNHAPDITRGATHYHADYVDPRWSKSMSVQATYGAHIYYTNVVPAAGAN